MQRGKNSPYTITANSFCTHFSELVEDRTDRSAILNVTSLRKYTDIWAAAAAAANAKLHVWSDMQHTANVGRPTWLLLSRHTSAIAEVKVNVDTATSHADAKTLLISTTLALCASRHWDVTTSDVFAFELVTVTGVAQEERLQSRIQYDSLVKQRACITCLGRCV